MSDGVAATQLGNVRFADLGIALDRGIRDFMRAPQFGLFFAAVYVVLGCLLLWLGAGHLAWVLAAVLGFPLAAPFAAVGLYEVSRRLEAGVPLTWRGVLGAVWLERGRQMPWIGAIIIFIFMFWAFVAHTIFAFMMGLRAMTNITEGLDALMTPHGLAMIGVEMIAGGAIALLVFAITVMSLPMLLDRELDFVTAMLTSIKTVAANPVVLLSWAALIAVVTVAAMIPWFLGLLIVMPILGHASWHLYRRAFPA